LVSVIIPSFRVKSEWFKQTLDSLQSQTLKNFEVIIINDADPTFQVNASFPARIVAQKWNQGLACSRNVGALNARAPFILFLDPDDILDPMALEKLLLFGVPLVGSQVKHYHGVNIGFVYSGTIHFGDKKDKTYADYDSLRLRKENFLTSTALISRDLYLQVGGMCPRSIIKYYEDYDFWLRLNSMGYHGRLLREPLFHYRRHKSGQSNTLVQNVPEGKWKNELKEHNPVAFGELSWQFFCDLLSQRDSSSKNFPCYGSVRKKNAYSLFGLSFGDLPLEGKNWCETDAWVHQLNVEDVYNRIQVKEHDNKIGILYLVPWMVMGGADLYDLNVLLALKSDPMTKYHITLVVARHIEIHAWENHFTALADEVFHLQRMANHSVIEDHILDHIIRSRNIKFVVNSKTIAGYRAFNRWGLSHNKLFLDLKKMDILHLYEPYSRDSWEWRGAQVSWAMQKRVVVSEDLKVKYV
jgi:glycosyltransferase involved in cell wall biosynthesis